MQEAGEIFGYAAITDNIDLNGDCIKPGAFAQAEHIIYEQPIPLLWQHQVIHPIGSITHLQEDQKGLKIQAQIKRCTQKAEESYQLVKSGVINGLSIGFAITRAYENEQGMRMIEALHLYEVSIVTFPANPDARIAEVKTRHDLLTQQQHENIDEPDIDMDAVKLAIERAGQKLQISLKG